MTHDELLAKINANLCDIDGCNSEHYKKDNLNGEWFALRAVVELSIKQLDTTNMPAEQVGWFHEGYNLAMDNVIDVIEKELG